MEAVEIASIKDLGERGECDLCPKVMVKSERPSAETASISPGAGKIAWSAPWWKSPGFWLALSHVPLFLFPGGFAWWVGWQASAKGGRNP